MTIISTNKTTTFEKMRADHLREKHATIRKDCLADMTRWERIKFYIQEMIQS